MISKNATRKKSSRAFVWVSALLLSSLLVVSILMLWRHTRQVSDVVIVQDIAMLQKVFKKIHADCYISNFEHTRNYIDFLNVISFVGSRVGSMNLVYAKNWQGPYLKNNPTIQEKFYVLLRNKQGYFIVPGNGVRLSNGKVIGQDIILDETTDMMQLMTLPEGLASHAGALAAPIKIGSRMMSNFMQAPELLMVID